MDEGQRKNPGRTTLMWDQKGACYSEMFPLRILFQQDAMPVTRNPVLSYFHFVFLVVQLNALSCSGTAHKRPQRNNQLKDRA